MNTPQTTIGLRLLSERKRLGLLQSDVISATGISKMQYHRYENNLAVPSTSSTQKLTSIGFDMTYVLNGTLQNESLNKPQPIQESFEHIVLRLKQELGIFNDAAIAQMLGLTRSAFSERKKRNAFPKAAFLTLLDQNKTLVIDANYVLRGTRTTQSISAIEQTIGTDALTLAQNIRLTLLTKTEVGQKILADFLYITQQGSLDPLDASARFFVQLEKIVQWTLGEPQTATAKTPHHLYTQLTQVHADLPNSAASAISPYVPTKPISSNIAVSTKSGQVDLPSNPSHQHIAPNNLPPAQSLSTLKHQEHEAVEATQQPKPQLAPPVSASSDY